MVRLSDLINQGKDPEKKQKEEVRIRDLTSLKEDKEEVVKITQEEESSSEEIIEMDLPVEGREEEVSEFDLPTEAKTESKKEELFEKPDVASLESISLPSEEELAAPSSEELEKQKRIENLYTSSCDFIEGVFNSLKRKQKFTIDPALFTN